MSYALFVEDTRGERVVAVGWTEAIRVSGKDIDIVPSSYLPENSQFVYRIFATNRFGASNGSAPVEIRRLICK